MASDFHSAMMRRALELAERGIGQVSPSPLVGCVVVSDEGNVLGEGYYLYQGVKHAEMTALEVAGPAARGATAYISLEPHSHHGRTPPCTGALIEAGIRRVFAPLEDPNPLVSGKGFTHLREAGVEVNVGLLAKEAARVNEKYIRFMQEGIPFVHLKLATSLDGRIATRAGDSRWITGEDARARVHHLRHEYDAILVGSGTAIADDPLLTDRSGRNRHRPLTRVVLDGELRLRPNSKLAKTARESPVIIFADERADPARETALTSCGIEVVRSANGPRDLSAVLKSLGTRFVQSLLIEGGSTVSGAFLDAGLVDKVTFFIAPLIIGGVGAPMAIGGEGAERIADAVRLRDVEITREGQDVEITGYAKATASDE